MHANIDPKILLFSTVNAESRLVFFQTALEVMSDMTRGMSLSERQSILDARNADGNTCLHVLAGAKEKMRTEYCCQSIHAMLRAGADKVGSSGCLENECYNNKCVCTVV